MFTVRRFEKPLLITLLLVMVYGVLFSSLSLTRHWDLKTQLADLGNMDQAISQTVEGNFMWNSSGGVGQPRWGGHMNVILLVFVPFYAMGFGPELLLVAQSIAVGLTAFPIYWFAKRKTGKPWLGTFFAAVFLLNPTLQDAALYDFHPIVFGLPFLAMAFNELDQRRYRQFAVFALLTLLLKEDMPLIVIMFGLYILLVQRNWKVGTATMVIALGYFLLITQVLMPAFRANPDNPGVLARYGEIGSSVSEIALTAVTNPHLFFGTLFEGSRLIYVITLFIPFAFVPLLGLPVLLMAAPTFLVNMLSQGPWMHRPFGFYYSAPIVLFLTLATISGIAWITARKRSPILRETLVIAIGLMTIALSALAGPLPLSNASSGEYFTVSDHARRLPEIAQYVPDTASLSVQNNLGTRFSHRRDIYVFPIHKDRAEYVLVDAYDPNPEYQGYRPWHFLMTNGKPLNQFQRQTLEVFDDPAYGLIRHMDTFYLFQRGASRAQNAHGRAAFLSDTEKLRSDFVERYGPYYDQIVTER